MTLLKAGHSAKQSGFSLIELVVVVAIFSVLVALGIPHIDTRRHDLNTVTHQVVADLRFARARAITSGEHFSVLFSAFQYKVQRHKEVAGAWPVKEIVKTVELPGNLSVNIWPQGIRFNTRGMMVSWDSPVSGGIQDTRFDSAREIEIWPSGQIHEVS